MRVLVSERVGRAVGVVVLVTLAVARPVAMQVCDGVVVGVRLRTGDTVTEWVPLKAALVEAVRVL